MKPLSPLSLVLTAMVLIPSEFEGWIFQVQIHQGCLRAKYVMAVTMAPGGKHSGITRAE
jgi:hypothetical protein